MHVVAALALEAAQTASTAQTAHAVSAVGYHDTVMQSEWLRDARPCSVGSGPGGAAGDDFRTGLAPTPTERSRTVAPTLSGPPQTIGFEDERW